MAHQDRLLDGGAEPVRLADLDLNVAWTHSSKCPTGAAVTCNRDPDCISFVRVSSPMLPPPSRRSHSEWLAAAHPPSKPGVLCPA